MIGLAAPTAIVPAGVRGCLRLGRAESRRRCARVVSDRTAPLRSATRPEGRRHLRPNVEIACGEVSCWPPKGSQTISKPKTVRERCKWVRFGAKRHFVAPYQFDRYRRQS